MQLPDAACHKRAEQSAEAVTTSAPSGDHIAEFKHARWPSKLCEKEPDVCHSRAVRSWDAVSKWRPSGEKLTVVRSETWPLNVLRHSPLLVHHTLA